MEVKHYKYRGTRKKKCVDNHMFDKNADCTSSLLTGMILIFLEHFNAANNVFETGL